jgi:hypothetical protein
MLRAGYPAGLRCKAAMADDAGAAYVIRDHSDEGLAYDDR